MTDEEAQKFKDELHDLRFEHKSLLINLKSTEDKLREIALSINNIERELLIIKSDEQHKSNLIKWLSTNFWRLCIMGGAVFEIFYQLKHK
ncbi:MAG: hypothetical protein KAS32_11400 [Candidatus Peribacteraceae bacterium]|nr:hypothetical protein [Candidatus Peribacteraceae bacterium]